MKREVEGSWGDDDNDEFDLYSTLGAAKKSDTFGSAPSAQKAAASKATHGKDVNNVVATTNPMMPPSPAVIPHRTNNNAHAAGITVTTTQNTESKTSYTESTLTQHPKQQPKHQPTRNLEMKVVQSNMIRPEPVAPSAVEQVASEPIAPVTPRPLISPNPTLDDLEQQPEVTSPQRRSARYRF